MTEQARKGMAEPERKALAYLAAGVGRSTCATRWIAKNAGLPTANMAQTRRMLARFASKGWVEPVRSGGRIYWWRITDAGRAAIAEAKAES